MDDSQQLLVIYEKEKRVMAAFWPENYSESLQSSLLFQINIYHRPIQIQKNSQLALLIGIRCAKTEKSS
jgi:hypothetical protein